MHDCNSDDFVIEASLNFPDDPMLANDANEMFSNEDSKESSWKDNTAKIKCTVNAGIDESYFYMKSEVNHVK